MNRKQLKCCLLGAVFLFGGCTASDPTNHLESSADTLFQIKPDQNRAALERQSSTDKYLKLLLNWSEEAEVKEVQVKPGLVSKDTTMLSMPLTDGRTVSFKLSRSDSVAPGMLGWIGDMPSNRRQLYPSPAEIDMDPLNWVSLVSDGNLVVGDIRVDGQLYRLTAVGKGQQVLVKVDESKLPPEAPPIPVPVQAQPKNRSLSTSQSPKSTIRVLFVTTRQSRAMFPNYKIELVQALQNANQYLINSKVDAVYELSDIYDSDYDETGKTPETQRGDMEADKPLGAKIHIEREKGRADLVSMLSTFSIYCGIGVVTATVEKAFSAFSCFGALGHELGHNMGALHHRGEATPALPDYAYGYEHTAPNFHTQMRTFHGAIPYHANPRLQYQGVPIGTVEYNDVARRFNERRDAVANFYPDPAHPVRLWLYGANRGCFIDLKPGEHTLLSWSTECKDNDVDPVRVVVKDFYSGSTPRKLCFSNILYTVHSCYTAGNFSGDFEITSVHSGGGKPEGFEFTRRLIGPVYRVSYE